MNCTQREKVAERAAEKAAVALARFVFDGLQQNMERVRSARAGYALLSTGCSICGSFPWEDLARSFLVDQQPDGGWSDVEESLWCLGYLTEFDERYESEILKGKKWLDSVRLPCGALGKSERDRPRIPITALASVLVPDAVGNSGLKWLEDQWEADLAGSTQLTYKGAFFLISQRHDQAPDVPDLIERTIAYLCREQNDDGGFAPWKDHPVGGDPWTTGVVLWGLSKFPQRVLKDVIDRAVKWLQTNQLPNGLWPYHYLDDGSSMALIGLSSVLPILGES